MESKRGYRVYLLPEWMWYKNFTGFALFSLIFVKYLDKKLIAHEEAHAEQWKKDPWLFHIKYLYYLFTVGYWDNPYEVEARKAEIE